MTKPKKKADHAEAPAAEIKPPEPPAPAVPETKDIPVADVGASLYRDRSAEPRTNQITEGQANFATITKAARGDAADA